MFILDFLKQHRPSKNEWKINIISMNKLIFMEEKYYTPYYSLCHMDMDNVNKAFP